MASSFHSRLEQTRKRTKRRTNLLHPPPLDPLRLRNSAESSAIAYKGARPFPHAVIDGLFEEQFLEIAADHFPGPGDIVWYEYDNPFERKLSTNRIEDIPPVLVQIMTAMNSNDFVAALETV